MSIADYVSLPFGLRLSDNIRICIPNVLRCLVDPGKGVIGNSLQFPGILQKQELQFQCQLSFFTESIVTVVSTAAMMFTRCPETSGFTPVPHDMKLQLGNVLNTTLTNFSPPLLQFFSFFSLFTGKTCPLYAAPKNGALACNKIDDGTDICVAMCNNKFDFVFNPPMVYFCSAGQWSFYTTPSTDYSTQLPWPDCSSKLISLLLITVTNGGPYRNLEDEVYSL